VRPINATIFEDIQENRLYLIHHRTRLNGLPTQYNDIGLHQIPLVLSYHIQLHSFYFNSDTAATTLLIILIAIYEHSTKNLFQTKITCCPPVSSRDWPGCISERIRISGQWLGLGGVGHCFAWHVRVSSGLTGA
jgi:hypothetical protein